MSVTYPLNVLNWMINMSLYIVTVTWKRFKRLVSNSVDRISFQELPVQSTEFFSSSKQKGAKCFNFRVILLRDSSLHFSSVFNSHFFFCFHFSGYIYVNSGRSLLSSMTTQLWRQVSGLDITVSSLPRAVWTDRSSSLEYSEVYIGETVTMDI